MYVNMYEPDTATLGIATRTALLTSLKSVGIELLFKFERGI